MVIQLVGRQAEWLARGAQLAEAAGAEIIDINMGCPAKEVTGGLSGSALMRDLDLAERLIAAAVNATSRPVTLKMRLGWDDAMRNAPELAQRAERIGVQAITVHGRTRQQFYKGTANWRAVAEVKAAVRIPVIVNGDIVDATSAREALKQSGTDAVMIGRGGYGRPWIAREIGRALHDGGDIAEPGLTARLAIALDHFHDTLRFLWRHARPQDFPQASRLVHRERVLAARCRGPSRHEIGAVPPDHPRDVEAALTALWSEQRLAA